MTLTAEDKSRIIAKAASDKKALDIVILNMHDLTTTTDFFIVCSATTSTQVRAIADNIEEEMNNTAGEMFLHKEGYRNAEWILLDFGNCIVHIFTEEARRFYGLERLWGEAPIGLYED